MAMEMFPSGCSPIMSALEQDADLAARSDVHLLISGEAGVGKEFLAQLVHARSRRSRGPLAVVRCAKRAASLVESELFGAARTAAAPLDGAEPGQLERAQGGSLLIDDIEELSLPAQERLMQLLETGRHPDSSPQSSRTIDARVMAISGQDMFQRVANHEFHETLYYRLNVIHLRVPALRDRREDIPQLVTAILEDLGTRHSAPVPHISLAAMARLQAHDWPGNVRGLQMVLEALLTSRAGFVAVADLPEEVTRPRHQNRKTWTGLPAHDAPEERDLRPA